MAFAWILAIVTLMTGSPNEWELKREKSEEDQTGTSQQGITLSASSESRDSTGWETLYDKENAEVGETAVQEGQHVNSLISEYTGERRARRSDEHLNESLVSLHSEYLVPLRTEAVTAPPQPSRTHEGESSQHSSSLSSLHREQQQLLAEYEELTRDVIRLSAGLKDIEKGMQTIKEMKLFLEFGHIVSDKSDSD